jgi:TolA-binding protein
MVQMRTALLFVLACSSPPKPEPATPTETTETVETKPMPVEAVPVDAPPAEPLSDDDLESPAQPKRGEQAKIAWQSNSDGVALAKQQKYDDASSKFRDAVARVPDPAYFYNLCHALYQQGRYSNALVACGAIGKNAPSPALQMKGEQLSARVATAAKQTKVQE